ncbi:MAG: ABC transporter permease [Candidatus Acidiferrales bacterium]
MRSFWQDLRYGIRQLRLSPGFALVGILSLALGIGANTAIFQLIDAIRLRTIPAKDPAQLATVRIADRTWASGSFYSGYSDLTYPIWQQIQQRQQAFSPIAVWGTRDFNLALGGEVHYAHGIWVSGDFFKALGVQPYRGRLISSADDTTGCGTAGVDISYSFWQREYGGEPSALGKQITLDGNPFVIIGITPPGFHGVTVGDPYDVAVPVCSERAVDGEHASLTVRRNWWLASIGRLKPGWTLAQATAQLKVISAAVMQETLPPQYDADGAKHYLAYQLAAYPAAIGFSELRKQSEASLWLLMGISALVLLIACANIANLMLARASARDREIAVRLALGASRRRLIRQLLSESLLLAMAGTICGAFLAWTLSQSLISFLSTANNPVFVDLSLDWRVLGFMAALAFLTTILFGLMPALRATRTAPVEALKSGGRGMTASREKFGLRRALVISQVALSLVLLVGALLFVRSLRNLLALDPGFQQNGILIANLDFARLKIPDAQRFQFDRNLLQRLRAVPGLESVAGAMTTPLSGWMSNDNVLGDTDTPAEKRESAMINYTSSDYFKTLETPLLEGRDFGDGDTATSPKVAIVNQAFVKKFLGGKDALGKTFRLQQPQGEEIPVFQVVGVVKNAVYRDMHEEFQPTAYFPLAQQKEPYPDVAVVVRSSEQLPALINSVKEVVADVNPEIDIDFRVFKTQVHDTLLQDELMATLSGFFGFLAALLAVIGLYGVISYMVAQRRNEIGIRMALGAQQQDVIRMVMREAGILLAIGLAAGTALGLLAAKGAASLLFGLKPRDPVTFLVSIAALAAVASLAGFVPARRAATLDPWTALRDE